MSQASSQSTSSYRDTHARGRTLRSARAVTPFRSFESDSLSTYDSAKPSSSTTGHEYQHHNRCFSPTVPDYDYHRRPFSPTYDSSSRYSQASSGHGPSTFQHPSNYRPSIDRTSAHRSFDSTIQSIRPHIRGRNRAINRYDMIRSKSANPPDRDFARNDYLYCASNLESSYRPSTYDRFDRYDLYSSRRPLYTSKVAERRVTQNSDIKLMHNVMTDDASIKWFRNGKELTKSSRCRSVYREGLAMLEIFSAQLTDTAKYTCVARNKLGFSSYSSHLKVFPDSITEPLPPIFTRAMKGELCFFCVYLSIYVMYA